MYIEIQTHACIYLRKICYVYILNIFIYNIKYNTNIYCIYLCGYFYILCVYIYIYIYNKHSTHTYIMITTFILDAINHD